MVMSIEIIDRSFAEYVRTIDHRTTIAVDIERALSQSSLLYDEVEHMCYEDDERAARHDRTTYKVKYIQRLDYDMTNEFDYRFVNMNRLLKITGQLCQSFDTYR
jgi:hypothetical protein